MKKEHRSKQLQSDFSRIERILSSTVTLLTIILLISSAWAAAPPSSVPGSTDYEISIGELKKVKKDRPVKKEIKSRKKIKSESTTQREVAEPSQKVEQLHDSSPSVLNSTVLSDSQQQSESENKDSSESKKIDKAEFSTTGPVTIHHDPYSYVITGKRTTIQAVISSAENIQSVFCRFRAAENGAYAVVPMVQEPDTLFTYAATLPSLATVSRSLRYSIIAVDSLGNETRSQEFIIAVKATKVLPGWQLEKSSDMIKIKLENREKPLNGFSDSGIVVE